MGASLVIGSASCYAFDSGRLRYEKHSVKEAMRVATAVRGSTSGRPLMVLLDILGQRWTLRILWELRDGPASFRVLQERCDGLSPSVLNDRLKRLRTMALLERGDAGYGLTDRGRELGRHFAALDAWAMDWAAALGEAHNKTGEP